MDESTRIRLETLRAATGKARRGVLLLETCVDSIRRTAYGHVPEAIRDEAESMQNALELLADAEAEASQAVTLLVASACADALVKGIVDAIT